MITLEQRVTDLERELRARDLTIAALSDAVEDRMAGNDLQVAVEMARLEQLCDQRTEELATRRGALEGALLELRTTQDQLLQAQKLEAIGQLAAGIAHEINTPMQYIGDNARFLERAFTELLAAISDAPRAEPDPRRQRRLDLLRERIPRAIASTCEGVDAVSRIVRAMKEFSHPGTGERTRFDLNQAIRSTSAVTRNEWKYCATLDLELGEDLPLVLGYQHEMNQVLLNMIVNAAHAVTDRFSASTDGTPQGRIVVTTTRDPDGIRIVIADNGVGIPAAIRNRVFDPFFTTKPVGKGTGQGLAIARSIVVDKHCGTLAVDSDDAVDSPTRGTRFVITLPAIEGSQRIAVRR